MSLLKEKLELKAEEAEFRVQKILSGFQAWQKWAIIVCLAAGIPGYFISKALGNYYYTQQYRQFLITAHPSFQAAKKLVLDRVDIASLGGNEFAAAAQVVNQNLDLAAKAIPYEFKFYLSDGQPAVAPISGKFYILPNQRKYLVAPNLSSNGGIVRAELILPEQIRWQKKTDLPEIKLITSRPKGQDQSTPFGYVLEGSVINSSPYYLKEIQLVFLLYGAGGKIIGASQRTENTFKPFEKRDYKQIWAGISGRNVVRAEAIAETNLLEKENFTLPAVPTSNGAGDLNRE